MTLSRICDDFSQLLIQFSGYSANQNSWPPTFHFCCDSFDNKSLNRGKPGKTREPVHSHSVQREWLSTYFWQLPHPLKTKSFLLFDIPKKLDRARARAAHVEIKATMHILQKCCVTPTGLRGIPKRKSTRNAKLDIPKALHLLIERLHR